MTKTTICTNCHKQTAYELTACEHCGCCPFCGEIVKYPYHYCEAGGWNTDRQEEEADKPDRDDEMNDMSQAGFGLLILAVLGMGVFVVQYVMGI